MEDWYTAVKTEVKYYLNQANKASQNTQEEELISRIR